MEDQQIEQPKTNKYALTYGAILGGISVVFGIILFSMDLHYQGGIPVFIVSLLFMLSLIIIGMIAFKKANAGYMTIGQGLKVGIGISLVGGIIGMIFQLVLSNVIDPEFTTKLMEYQRTQLAENSALTQEQIEQQIELSQNFSKPWIQIAFGLLGSIFFGFIFAIIPSLVMKKTKND